MLRNMDQAGPRNMDQSVGMAPLTPSNEWWRFTVKPQMRLLSHKRTRNDQTMSFYVRAAVTTLPINYRIKQNTDGQKLHWFLVFHIWIWVWNFVWEA